MTDITPARLQKVLQQLKNQSPLAGTSKTEQIKNSLKDDTKHFDCRPWDYSMFLRRVRTYQVMTWFGKPKKINPFACARFGWINCDFDLLECPSCKQRLLFAPAKQLTQQGVEEAAAVFQQQLDTAHSEYCPWRNNPSPSHFTHLPHDQSKVLELFSARFASFQSTPLPVLTASCHDRVTQLIDDKLDVLVETRERKEAVKNAFILAMCGWECLAENEQKLIYCSQCQRRIALSQCTALVAQQIDEHDVSATIRQLRDRHSHAMDELGAESSPSQAALGRKRDREQFEGDTADQAANKRPRTEALLSIASDGAVSNAGTETSTSGDGPVSTAVPETSDTLTTRPSTLSPYNSPTASLVRDKPFDPVTEHRYFCPWINSYEESAQTSLEAWQKGLVALFSLPAPASEQVAAPKSFSDFQTILNRIRTVVQTPNKSVHKV